MIIVTKGVITILSNVSKLIKGGFLHILFGNTMVKMIGFISSIVIVRLVTKEEYAYLAYSNNIYSYINLFAGLGLSTALLKYCSTSTSKQERKAYFTFALKYGGIFQLTLSIFMCLIIMNIDIPFEGARSLIYLSVFLPLLGHFVTTVQQYNRSQLQNKLYSGMALTQTVITFIFSVTLVLLLGVKGTIFAQYIAVIVAIIIGLTYVFKDLSNTNKIKLPKKDRNAFFKMGISLMVAHLFSMMMQINEMFLVNNLIGDENATANYKVAMLIPSQLGIVTGSIMIYFFPIIAKMTDFRAILKKSIKIGLFSFGIITFISILGFILTPYIIKYLYGVEYSDSIQLSYIFWGVYLLNAGFRIIPMNILPAIGKVGFNSMLSIISAVVHVIMSYYFISSLGIMGAAYAIGIVYFVSGILYWWYLYIVCKKEIRNVTHKEG